MINFETLSGSSIAILSISIILMSGFLATRLTRLLKLPNVTAYIITGIILGPYVLKIIPLDFVKGTAFLPEVALSFIAFSTGEFFRLETLKKSGIRILIITLSEALMAFMLVYVLSFFFLKLGMEFSLVLAALATATAPASTMMTIRQTGANGDFVATLLQVVALDDVVALLAYSIAVAICKAADGTSLDIMEIIQPIIYNLMAIILGAVFALIMGIFINTKRSTDNRLIIALAVIFGYCGICTIFDVSPLLGCMVMGSFYINITDDDRLFKQLNYFSPPILLMFFVRSGINFNIGALFSTDSAIGSYPLLIVGILYFVIRIVGKYLGAYLGCKIVNKSDLVAKNLGMALFPQAGVAIGLAALGSRIIGGKSGVALNTIIMTSSILYELVGPVCAKLALQNSGSFPDDNNKHKQIEHQDENENAYNEAIDEVEKDNEKIS